MIEKFSKQLVSNTHIGKLKSFKLEFEKLPPIPPVSLIPSEAGLINRFSKRLVPNSYFDKLKNFRIEFESLPPIRPVFKGIRINDIDNEYRPSFKDNWIGFNRKLNNRIRYIKLRNLTAVKGPVDTFQNVPSFIYLYPQYLDNMKKQIIDTLKDINDNNAKIINRI